MCGKRTSASVLGGASVTVSVTRIFLWTSFGCILASALTCGPCNKSECISEPNNCTGGYTLDVCECCKVCAKLVNETCGGKYNLEGNCGEGLECALVSKIGAPITGNEVGICRGKALYLLIKINRCKSH